MTSVLIVFRGCKSVANSFWLFQIRACVVLSWKLPLRVDICWRRLKGTKQWLKKQLCVVKIYLWNCLGLSYRFAGKKTHLPVLTIVLAINVCYQVDNWSCCSWNTWKSLSCAKRMACWIWKSNFSWDGTESSSRKGLVWDDGASAPHRLIYFLNRGKRSIRCISTNRGSRFLKSERIILTQKMQKGFMERYSITVCTFLKSLSLQVVLLIMKS